MNDPYQTLGLYYGCNTNEASQRFRELSKRFHPDRAGGNAQIFQRIQHAYDVVRTPFIEKATVEEEGNCSSELVTEKLRVLRAALVAASELRGVWDTRIPEETSGQDLEQQLREDGQSKVEEHLEKWYAQTEGVLYELQYHSRMKRNNDEELDTWNSSKECIENSSRTQAVGGENEAELKNVVPDHERRFRRPLRRRRDIPTRFLHMSNTGPLFNIELEEIEKELRAFLASRQDLHVGDLEAVIHPRKKKPFVVVCFTSTTASTAVIQVYDRKHGAEPFCNRVVACSYAEECLNLNCLVPSSLPTGPDSVGDTNITPLQILLRLQDSIMKSTQADESGLIDMKVESEETADGECNLVVCPLCRAEFNQVRSLRMHLTSPAKHALADSAAISTAVRISRLESRRMQNQLKSLGIAVGKSPPSKVKNLPSNSIQNQILLAVKDGDDAGLRKLLSSHPEVDPSGPLDEYGSTALHWAAGTGSLDCCKVLVDEFEVDASQECVWGRKNKRNALHWSARNNQVHVMHWLVHEKSVDVDSVTDDGTHAFAWAVWQHHFLAARWLLANGSRWKRENDWGCNPVHWAAVTGNLEMCQWLHSRGLDITISNKQGHSALHKAAYGGHLNVCRWLLQACPGAFDPSAPDKAGYSSSLIASERGHHDLATWLDSWKVSVQHEEGLENSGPETQNTARPSRQQDCRDLDGIENQRGEEWFMKPSGPVGKLVEVSFNQALKGDFPS